MKNETWKLISVLFILASIFHMLPGSDKSLEISSRMLGSMYLLIAIFILLFSSEWWQEKKKRIKRVFSILLKKIHRYFMDKYHAIHG